MKLKVMSLVFAVIGFLFSLIFQSMASISEVVFGGEIGYCSGAIISLLSHHLSHCSLAENNKIKACLYVSFLM